MTPARRPAGGADPAARSAPGHFGRRASAASLSTKCQELDRSNPVRCRRSRAAGPSPDRRSDKRTRSFNAHSPALAAAV